MHNVEHYDYKENIDKKAVYTDLNNYVEHATWAEGGNGIEPIRWNDYVCESYEAAKEWIQKHDKGWYDQLAVKYKTPVRESRKSDKLKELEQKILDAYSEYNKRNNALYPKTRTSEYIGCGQCGSKLSSKHLTSNRCPVCHEDLRPETMLKSIAAAEAKWKRAQAIKKEYVDKHSKKEIRWLVKIEYHT